jgi:hypothetical protein
MRDSGKMIFSMVKEKKCGQMALFTSKNYFNLNNSFLEENIIVVKNMVKVDIVGMMDQHMKEIGLKIKSKDMELING